jgi:2-desacetyl-2-hydroxyethyl bacteriochlorophyllide A dehydrogenase
MRQVVLQEARRFVERDVPVPAPGANEALVRIRRVGVCGTDFHAFAGTQPLITFPRVLGHEVACEIVEAPANERGLAAGDCCAVEPYLSCGNCRTCRLGRPNCCERLRVLGVHVDGAMQSFLAIPLNLLHRSNRLSFDQLALVETLGIGAHAVQRSKLAPGEEALVVGAGPIGLSVFQFAHARGSQVRVIEPRDIRRAFAGRFGAEVLDAWDGRVADVVFDATGSSASMAQSLAYVAPGGRLVFVGLCRDAVPLDDPVFHAREVTLLASRNSCDEFPRIIQMIETGSIDTTPWITDRVQLADVPRVFDELRQRTALIKAIVEV